MAVCQLIKVLLNHRYRRQASLPHFERIP